MKYILKNKRGYIDRKADYIDVGKELTIEFDFEGKRPTLIGQGLYAIISGSRGDEYRRELIDDVVTLDKGALNVGLYSITVVLVTGTRIDKAWRCEPFSLESLTEVVKPICELNEAMELRAELMEAIEELEALKGRVEQLENEYDPRNV